MDTEIQEQWKKMRHKLAMSGATGHKHKLKLLRNMKQFAKENNLEFSQRYEDYIIAFEKLITQPPYPKAPIYTEKEGKGYRIGTYISFEEDGITYMGRIDASSINGHGVRLIDGQFDKRFIERANTNFKWFLFSTHKFKNITREDLPGVFDFSHLLALSEDELDTLLNNTQKYQLVHYLKQVGLYSTMDSIKELMIENFKKSFYKRFKPELLETKPKSEPSWFPDLTAAHTGKNIVSGQLALTF